MSALGLEIEELKVIYSEIINGYTFFENKNLYVKHLTELENAEIARKKYSLFLKFKKEGLLTEEEKLKQIIDAEIWSKEKEDQITEFRYIISDNEKNLVKIIPQQHAPILRLIEEARGKLFELLIDRRDAIGITANEYSEKKSIHYMVYLSLYKDNKLKQKVFNTPEELDEAESEELDEYIDLLKESFGKYSEEIIKKISVMPFFLNYVVNCKDNLTHFLGKPIVEFTSYQLQLLALGVRNINITSQSSGEPPELMDDTKIQDIVNWYDKNFSIILGKRKE